MCRLPNLLLSLLAAASPLFAQTSAPEDLNVQISAVQGWVDTGLDLQTGDSLEISAVPSSAAPNGQAGPACDPKGVVSDVSQNAGLPLPSAPAGALIARLEAQGSTPILVGGDRELRIEKPSHLFLGMNASTIAVCQGGFAVKVRRTPASSGSVRSEQLKSQLATAAQIFMQGQFGTAAASDTTGGSAAAPTPLKVSNAQLEGELRKDIDGLPRRVNDQFHNLGDMVNFVVVGSQKNLQAALDAASWHIADTSNGNAVVSAIMQTYENKDYLTMPMSTLFLFGRKQDFGYEMAEPIAMVASRHHFRIWKAPFMWKGQEVWVGAGTHDIGFAKDKRNGSVTHKIDPVVDGERDNIGSSLQKANQVKQLSYYLPANPVKEAKNATGDMYQSDGRVLIIFLQ